MIAIHKISFAIICMRTFQNSFAQHIKMSLQEEINSLLALSDSLLTSFPDQSLDYAKQAFLLSEKYEYEESKLIAMISLAEIYRKKTDLKTALNIANKAKFFCS